MKWVGWRGSSQLGVCPEQASKGGRSSRSRWGQVSEEEPGQRSPASSRLGWPNPPGPGQWLLLQALGGVEEQGWRGSGGQGPKGTLEAFLLEINCEESAQIILQMRPASCGSWC